MRSGEACKLPQHSFRKVLGHHCYYPCAYISLFSVVEEAWYKINNTSQDELQTFNSGHWSNLLKFHLLSLHVSLQCNPLASSLEAFIHPSICGPPLLLPCGYPSSFLRGLKNVQRNSELEPYRSPFHTMANHSGKKPHADVDFTLRRVFGKSSFRYAY